MLYYVHCKPTYLPQLDRDSFLLCHAAACFKQILPGHKPDGPLQGYTVSRDSQLMVLSSSRQLGMESHDAIQKSQLPRMPKHKETLKLVNKTLTSS